MKLRFIVEFEVGFEPGFKGRFKNPPKEKMSPRFLTYNVHFYKNILGKLVPTKICPVDLIQIKRGSKMQIFVRTNFPSVYL